MYRIEINGRTIEGSAAKVLQAMSDDARFFEGDPAEYIEWLADSIRRTQHIFIDTAPGEPLERRQEVTISELLKHQLIRISQEGQRREKRKPNQAAPS